MASSGGFSSRTITEKRHIKQFSFPVEDRTEHGTQQGANMAPVRRIICGAVSVLAFIVLVTVKAETDRSSSDEEVDAIRNDALAEDYGKTFQDNAVEEQNGQFLLT